MLTSGASQNSEELVALSQEHPSGSSYASLVPDNAEPLASDRASRLLGAVIG